jgi:hypothetical protein
MSEDIIAQKLSIIADEIADSLINCETTLPEKIAGFKAIYSYWAVQRRISDKDSKPENAFRNYSASVAEAKGNFESYKEFVDEDETENSED